MTANRAEAVRLENGWVEFYKRYRWDWFVTLTYDHKRKAWGAEARGVALYRWLQRLEDLETDRLAARGRISEGVKLYALGAWEFHLDYALPPHIHLLIGGVFDLSRSLAWHIWQGIAGNSRILPFNPSKGGGSYLFKYVGAGSEVECWKLAACPVLQGIGRGDTKSVVE